MTSILAMSVSTRLKYARELGEISARDLSRLAGLPSEGHVSSLETSGHSPTVDTLSKIATVLGLSLDWLGRGEGTAPTAEQVTRAIKRARKHV